MTSENPKSDTSRQGRLRGRAETKRPAAAGRERQVDSVKKKLVLELAALAQDLRDADNVPAMIAAVHDFAAAAQRALSREAEEGGYAEAFDEAIARKGGSALERMLIVDWEETRRIAEALEDEKGEHRGPWRQLHVEGTLCYAHQTASEGNLALYAEYWNELDGMPRWEQLSERQRLVAVLRSARSHFVADLELTSDEFTIRMDPTTMDDTGKLLNPVRIPVHIPGLPANEGERRTS